MLLSELSSTWWFGLRSKLFIANVYECVEQSNLRTLSSVCVCFGESVWLLAGWIHPWIKISWSSRHKHTEREVNWSSFSLLVTKKRNLMKHSDSPKCPSVAGFSVKPCWRADMWTPERLWGPWKRTRVGTGSLSEGLGNQEPERLKILNVETECCPPDC